MPTSPSGLFQPEMAPFLSGSSFVEAEAPSITTPIKLRSPRASSPRVPPAHKCLSPGCTKAFSTAGGLKRHATVIGHHLESQASSPAASTLGTFEPDRVLPEVPGSETLEVAEPTSDHKVDARLADFNGILMQISGLPTDGSLPSSPSLSCCSSPRGEESPRRVFESEYSDAVANRRQFSSSTNGDHCKDTNLDGFKYISNAADKGKPPSSASSLLPSEEPELAPKATSRVQVGTPNDVAGVPVTPDPNNLSAAPTFLAPCFLSPLAPGATVASSTSQQFSQSSGLSAAWAPGASGKNASSAQATPKAPILLAPKPVLSPVNARGSALPPRGIDNKSLFALEDDSHTDADDMSSVGFAKRSKKVSTNSPFRKVKPAFGIHVDSSAATDRASGDVNGCASPPLAVSDLAAHVTTGMSPLDVLALSAESSPRADARKGMTEASVAAHGLSLDVEASESNGGDHQNMEDNERDDSDESPEEMAAKAIASFNEGYRRGYALGIRGGDPTVTTEALHQYYNDDEDGLSTMPRARGLIQYDSWASPWPNASIPCSMWGGFHNTNYNNTSLFESSSQSSRNSMPASGNRRSRPKARHVRRPVGKTQRKPLTALKPSSATFGPFNDDEKRALGIPVRQSGGNHRKHNHNNSHSNQGIDAPLQRSGPRPPPTQRAPLPSKAANQATSSRPAPTRRPLPPPPSRKDENHRPTSRQPSGVPGLCEVCHKPHNGSCGSGRFCSIACRNRCNGMKACKTHRASS